MLYLGDQGSRLGCSHGTKRLVTNISGVRGEKKGEWDMTN